MDSAWHRLGVHLDLREDPGLEARRKAERPGHWLARFVKGVRDLVVVIAVFFVVFCVLALLVHLVTGDLSLGGVLNDGLRFLGIAWGIAFLVYVVGRWLYWFVDHWVRRG